MKIFQREEKKRKKRGGKSECAWREKKRKISNIIKI
jgi:hypothetical protein